MATVLRFPDRIKPPFQDKISNEGGYVLETWTDFFAAVADALIPLGKEKSYQLKNNLAVAESIEGLSFDSRRISQVVVDFYIQRVTTGSGATEIVTTGTFHLAYKPTSNSWAIVTIGTPGPSTSGVTFSITADGSVQYTSTNVTGTAQISKITWRARTMAAKSNIYSTAGK